MTIHPKIKYFFLGNPDAVHTYWGRLYRHTTFLASIMLCLIVLNAIPYVMQFTSFYLTLGLLATQNILLVVGDFLHKWHLAEYYAIDGPYVQRESREHAIEYLAAMAATNPPISDGDDWAMTPSDFNDVARIKMPHNRSIREYADSITTGVDERQEDRHDND